MVETPYDQDIRRLQLKLDGTVLPYGDAAQKAAVEDKLRLKSEARAGGRGRHGRLPNPPRGAPPRARW